MSPIRILPQQNFIATLIIGVAYFRLMCKIFGIKFMSALNELPSGLSNIIFPYLILAISEYKLNKNKLQGIGLNNLTTIWFDKYFINKNGYFELIYM